MCSRRSLMRWDISGFRRLGEPETPGYHVIASPEEFDATYAPFEGAGCSRPDLSAYVLVGVHRGLCPTGGYWVRIVELKHCGSEVVVKVDIRNPRPGELVTLAMTYPADAVLVPKDILPKTEPVVFRFVDSAGKELARKEAVIEDGGKGGR